MIVFRKRLIVWLIKEYFKKWGKIVPIFILFGIVIFFLLQYFLTTIAVKIPIGQKEYIGIIGAYTLENLPNYILEEVSGGLTSISHDGKTQSSLAKYWKIQDNGKTYIFYLRDDLYFSDGKNFTSEDVNYNFSNVTIMRPAKYVVVFKLKETYAPFLVTVSRPIFRKPFIGIGEYKIKNLKLNGNFIESVTLASNNNQYRLKTYQVYPNVDSLKLGFMLGEISEAKGLTDIDFKKTKLTNYPNASLEKSINYGKLVALFYNNQDKILSDKKIRNALSYAIPDNFTYGKRSYAPYPDVSWAYKNNADLYEKYSQDIAHASLLLSNSNSATEGANLNLEIKTLPKYKQTAEEISKQWQKLNIKTKIVIVNLLPGNFQIFLGDFNVSKDPDQYSLWHSTQVNNITNYKSLRIDKFLEDGRQTADINERKNIYTDFQKYLLDDSPAAFLYFPYEYDLKRR